MNGMKIMKALQPMEVPGKMEMAPTELFGAVALASTSLNAGQRNAMTAAQMTSAMTVAFAF